MGVGGLVVPPEQLAIRRRDPDESRRGKLHVLAHSLEVDHDS